MQEREEEIEDVEIFWLCVSTRRQGVEVSRDDLLVGCSTDLEVTTR